MRPTDGMALVPRRWIYTVGLLSAVRGLGLVLVAEGIARGVASIAAGQADWRYAVALGLGGGLLRAGATWATSVAGARAAIGTKERIRASLADALLEGRANVGPMTALATRGLDDIDDYFTSALPAMTSVAIIPLMIGARILLADWLSAVILLVTVPLIPVFMVLVGKYTQERTDAAASALDRLSHHVVELARGLPVLVGLGRADEQGAALERISDDYRRTTMQTLRSAFLSSLVLELIATLSVAIVAVSIGIRLLGGNLGLETGLLVLVLAPECYAPFRDLGAAYHSSRAGTTALKRAQIILDQKSLQVSPTRNGPFGAAQLTVSYDDNEPIIDHLSFTLPRRGIVAVRGASGSGKSTLLAALVGRLGDGAIATGLIGIDPTRIGWAPQHPHTVASTVGEELAIYGTDAPAHRVQELLWRLGLGELEHVDPSELSPGELRRLAVARAVIRVDAGALVVVLDEPTAHLDDANATLVRDLIVETARRASVLVASHDDLLVTVADGSIQLGAPSALREVVAAPATVSTPSPRSASARIARPTLAPLVELLSAARGRYLAAALLGTLASLFAVALTAVSGWLIVRASTEPAIMYLLVAIVGVRFFGLGRAAFRYAERLVTHDAVLTSATTLRMRLWTSLAALGPGSRALQKGGTALDYLVAATDTVRDLIPKTLLPIAVGFITAAAALTATTLLAGELAWILAVTVAVCLIVAPMIALIVDRSAEASALTERSTVLRTFAAMLEAADDLRGNGVDGPVRTRLRQADQEIGAHARRSASSRGLAAAAVVLACCAAAAATMLAASALVTAGSIDGAVAGVLVLIPLAIIEPMVALVIGVQHIPALRTALGAVSGLETPVLSSIRGVASIVHRVEKLELRNVEGTWPGAAGAVFQNVSAVVETGQWLVIEGPSGSGKSTLLGTIFGDLEPSAGVIQLNGVDTEMLVLLEQRSHIAWCPQDAHIFESTIRANLLLGRRKDDRPTDAELHKALLLAGLGAFVSSLPLGLDTPVGSEGSRLSGGQRQRLAIARTLLSRAAIVMLDEPTAHLDESTARQLMSDLRTALSDRIVVLVTHHRSESTATDVHVRLDVSAQLAAIGAARHAEAVWSGQVA